MIAVTRHIYMLCCMRYQRPTSKYSGNVLTSTAEPQSLCPLLGVLIQSARRWRIKECAKSVGNQVIQLIYSNNVCKTMNSERHIITASSQFRPL